MEMSKFISVPVTGEGNQYVSLSGVKLVDAATATSLTTVISYIDGTATTLTHAAQVAFNMRDAIQDAIIAAQQDKWTKVLYDFTAPVAVSGIANA